MYKRFNLKKHTLTLISSICIIFTGALVLGNQLFFNREVDFNRDIRPVLNAKCMRCHGGVKRSGGLSLLFRNEALKPNESGLPAIVAGDADESELIRRITHTDPEFRMPLEDDPLSPEEIKLFKKWINDGAAWEDHGSFIPPQKPNIPTRGRKWAQNDIDHFVYQRMRNHGLSPSLKASKETLLRRLSLDLTGLPPKWEEIQAFVADSTEKAYENAVDRLLASPHFGERWASLWMDLSRYADSKGYERDPYRSIWKYRDYVIKSFNEDKPFDQFTVEQLAGDLLPHPTEEQYIATAFHRNSMTNTEGGTDDEEFRVMANLDRVNTTWTVWQGLTMECVQCHSHPYDPLLHREYYESYAFFNNTQDGDLKGEWPNYESFDPMAADTLREILHWIDQQYTFVELDDTQPLHEQLKDAQYPHLYPGDCDDFSHVTIYPDGVVSNWTNNVNSAPGRTFMFKFEEVDLTHVTHITYTYASPGNDGAMELMIDSLNGRQIQWVNFSQTGKIRGNEGGSGDAWKPYKASVKPVTGKHDLYFVIHNTTGEVPEGIITLKDIFLHSKDVQVDPKLSEAQSYTYQLRKDAVRTPVMKARTQGNRRISYVFDRGNWLVPADTVQPDVPGSLSAFPEAYPRNRLGFARWLINEQNPLTARVWVNRIWEQIFGRGIVFTLEDFGTQGFEPTHPELLDWLAVTHVEEDQWRLKALLKRIVMSATYQQQSLITDELREKDPENLWLARSPRMRLTPEQIRDQALAVSGLLNQEMYGKSVMPYQPEGIWQAVYNNQQWETSEGDDRYRRSIYTYWRRTSPHPAMIAFDAPSREFCVARRVNTNTPVQALVTLNDSSFYEMAVALAERTHAVDGELQDQLIHMYQQVMLRTPSQAKLEVMHELYEDAASHLKEEQMDIQTEKLHLQGLILVANMLLNLDEFITKS